MLTAAQRLLLQLLAALVAVASWLIDRARLHRSQLRAVARRTEFLAAQLVQTNSLLSSYAARIVLLESSVTVLEATSPPVSFPWSFVDSPPLLGEGFYVSGAWQAMRAVANAVSGGTAADADGVFDGVANSLMIDSGSECWMRLEPNLTGLNAPAPGKLIYTSWTTAGLFTTIEPTGGSGNFNAVRGKMISAASAYDPLAPTGSPVRSIFRPTVQVGPV